MGSISPRRAVLKDGRSVVIRTAEPEDAEGLLDAFREFDRTIEHIVTMPDERNWSLEHRRNRLAETIAHYGNIALVAVPEHDARLIVGELSFETIDRRVLAHHGKLGIGLREAWRGVGLGRVLMTTLLNWAAAHPTIEKVKLGCFARNTHALALYRSLGFVEEGRSIGEFKRPGGAYDDDVQMALFVKHVAPAAGRAVWVESSGGSP